MKFLKIRYFFSKGAYGKSFFFSKGYSFKKNKKKIDTASQHRRPQKGQKSRIFFLPIFFAFLAPPARCGSKVRKTHGSEVNIYRVMTRNESAVFKEESTLEVPLLHCNTVTGTARIERELVVN